MLLLQENLPEKMPPPPSALFAIAPFVLISGEKFKGESQKLATIPKSSSIPLLLFTAPASNLHSIEKSSKPDS
jgi:hypothetical protein